MRRRLAITVVLVLAGWAGVATGAPIATTNPTSLSFGNVEVGKTSLGQMVTVTNTGDAALTISNAVFVTNGTQYQVTSGVIGAQTTVLGPNASAMWTIACAPTSGGAKNGTFRVTSNSNNVPGTMFDITTTCSGQQGVLAISPGSYDFSGVRAGDTLTHNFTLTNTGNVTVSNISATLDPTLLGFSITTPTFPISLGAGASTMVTVQFAPAAGTDGCVVTMTGACTIKFAGGWGVTPTMTTASLVTLGDGLVVGLDTTPAAPNPLDFGSVRFDMTKTLAIAVVNTAGTAVGVGTSSITLGTAMAGEFAVTSCMHNSTTVACPTNAARYTLSGVNDTLTFIITCDPNNRVAMLDATFTVSTDLAVNPNRTVPLKANATTAALTTTPTNMVLDFGATDLDRVPVAVTRTIAIANTGLAPLGLGNGMTAGPNLARFSFSAITANVVQPGGAFEVDVTYVPTLEKPANVPDVATLTFAVAGVFGGPASLTLQLQGFGADRHLQISPVVVPDAYRNPGDAAPTVAVAVGNTGDVPLSLSSFAITGESVWSLVDPSPILVPPRGSRDVLVRFAPTTAGAAPMGLLTIQHDDDGASYVSQVVLSGTGLDRQVEMGPSVIDLGDVSVGVPVRLSDAAQYLSISSLETTNTLMIREITLAGDSAFSLVPIDTATTSDVVLPPESTQRFDVVVEARQDGVIETTATLFLDMDSEPQASVTIRARAASVSVHGGGGCSSTSGAGLAVGLLLLAIAGRRRSAVIGALATATLTAGQAHADDIDSESFRPTPTIDAETFQVEGADVGKHGEWAATACFTFAKNPMAVDAVIDGSTVSSERPVARRAGFELGGAYAFLGRFEAGLRVPLFQQSGDSGSDSGFHVPAASGTALGDIGVHTRVRIAKLERVSVAGALHVTLPTSTANQFVGIDGPSVRVLALATWRPLDQLAASATVGGVARAAATYSNNAAIRIEQGSAMVWGAGVALRATKHWLVTGEAFGELARTTMTGSVSPTEALAGVRYSFDSVTIGVAAGRGITTGLGAPDVRTVLSIVIIPNRRRSRVSEEHEHLPVTPVAPIVVDADSDGVRGAADVCPAEAEDRDGYRDDDGCPDPDNDGDLIADAQDRCPNNAEVINGIEDNDGCPDVAAEDGNAVSGNLSPTEAADVTFKRGRALMKDGKFKEACVAFEQSQRLDPQSGTQFNIATCYIEIGKLATAWNLFRELARVDKNADRRAEAAAAAAKLAPRVPKLRMSLAVSPMGLHVFINGANADALVGVDIPVDFGSYEIVAGAPDFKPWRKTVEVTEEAKTTAVTIDVKDAK